MRYVKKGILNRDTRKEAKTDDFSIKAVKIIIDASTSNGGMDICT